MAKRRKEEAQETRERILDAAISVFHERGVARPSLTEVAELAGVTRGAVYGHFRNKADLFAALSERVQLPGEAIDTIGNASSPDPLDELRARWLHLFRETADNLQWQQILAIIFHRCEHMTESEDIRERLLEGHATGCARLRHLLQAAVDHEQLPTRLDINTAVPMVHGSLVGLLQDWLLQPDTYDIAMTGERLLDALVDMLRHSPALLHE